MNIVEINKELSLWLLENKFPKEIREKMLFFVNQAYLLGFESGYSECKIVNFIDD